MTTSWPGCSQSRAPVKCDSPDAGHDNPCCRTRGRRPKASREGTRGEEFCGGALYGDFGIADGSAARRREGREQGSTALVSVIPSPDEKNPSLANPASSTLEPPGLLRPGRFRSLRLGIRDRLW